MALLELPPDPILDRARRAAGGEILHALRGDLDRDQRYGSRWLLASRDRIVVCGEDGSEETFPCAELRGVEVDELYGGGRLVALREGASPAPVIQYTNARAPEFAALAPALDALVRGGTPAPPPEYRAGHCARCALPLPERGGDCPRCLPRWRILARVLGLLRPYRAATAGLVALTLASVGLQIGSPYVTKMIVDEVMKGGRADRLGLWIGMLAGSSVLLLIVRSSSRTLTCWLGGRLSDGLRVRLHDAYQRARMDYSARKSSGDVYGRILSDTGELQHFLVDGLPYILVNLVSFAAIAAILLRLDWKLALLVFLPVPFLLGGGAWFRARLLPLFLRQSARSNALSSTLGESIQGLKVVKAFGREDERSARFARESRALARMNLRIENTLTGFGETMTFIMSLGVAAVWYCAGARIARHDPSLTLGDLLAFVGYIWMFYGPLQWFTMILNWMTRALAGAERLFAMLDARGEEPPGGGKRPLARARGAVRFRDVRFGYEPGKETIRGVTFAAEPGEMIGLVGKSGSGKSTLTHLLCRFYEPASGSIEIDGIPLADLRLPDLRRQIGMVLQEPILFNASILDNIRYARPDASFEEVVRAAQAAHAHEFILRKEEGYDTLVGEKGANLSGGERQRISIARAILGDPPILILDEATSSVDPETEALIQEAIGRLVRGRTTFAIAHRLSTLRHADRLLVLDQGRIVEAGTHAELMALDGHFARLSGAQAGRRKLQEEIWNA